MFPSGSPVKNMYAFVSSWQTSHKARLSNIWRATEIMKLFIRQFILDSARSDSYFVKKKKKKGSDCMTDTDISDISTPSLIPA
jgi:hypothetical protein